MQTLIDVILPVFLVIGAGYGAAWRGWFTETHVDGLMRFATGFAVPVLLFRAISDICTPCTSTSRTRAFVRQRPLIPSRFPIKIHVKTG